tara:strand:+ start:46 stop:252 length:207 start_codon:yes stop_codon:yes gene_type:complete
VKIGDLVKYCDSSEIPVHVAQDFDLFSVGIIVETCQHWEWAKVMWNNDDRRYRKHYFYQLEVISKKNE